VLKLAALNCCSSQKLKFTQLYLQLGSIIQFTRCHTARNAKENNEKIVYLIYCMEMYLLFQRHDTRVWKVQCRNTNLWGKENVSFLFQLTCEVKKSVTIYLSHYSKWLLYCEIWGFHGGEDSLHPENVAVWSSETVFLTWHQNPEDCDLRLPRRESLKSRPVMLIDVNNSSLIQGCIQKFPDWVDTK